MTDAQMNLRRQQVPSSKRHPSDKFRYSGVMVGIAAAAALAFAFMLRPAPEATQENTLRASELPQIN
jgi:hypothetical protein